MENIKKITTGALISYYRKKVNMKQDQLAYELDIAQSKISDWENDKISPSVDELVLLADILNIHPAQLIPQNSIHFHNEFKDSSVNNGHINNGPNINHYDSGIEEERKAYKEALRAKDEALRIKDEIIAELRKK